MGKASKRSRKKNHQKDLQKTPVAANTSKSNSIYVVARSDFRRLPRWPNDGIEQRRHDKECNKTDHVVDDPENIALRELLGFCPSPMHIGKLNSETRGFLLSLPYSFQYTAAQEQSDEKSAKQHLIDAYKRKDLKVMDLLEQINCRKAIYKASQEYDRFPDLRYLIVPLFQKNLMNDANIELLFGKISHVRHLLLDIGSQFAEPPPVNSPAGAFLSQFLQYKDEDEADVGVRVAPLPKSCAECGIVSKDNMKCSSCKTINYCGIDCQRKHWSIHKPDCLKAQGEEVPMSVMLKAQNALEKKKKQCEQQNTQDLQNAQLCFLNEYQSFLVESEQHVNSWAHCCRGKKLRIHVPTVNANNMIKLRAKSECGLQCIQDLSLGIYPDGIDDNIYGFRGLELENPTENGARIIVLFERLFEEGGDGAGCGLHIDGIFVVDKVIKNRATWILVPEPFSSYLPKSSRSVRLCQYLDAAKKVAKAVPSTVDLGIHNPGDPDISLLSTAFGNYVSLK